jgi:hypothetical protein
MGYVHIALVVEQCGQLQRQMGLLLWLGLGLALATASIQWRC